MMRTFFSKRSYSNVSGLALLTSYMILKCSCILHHPCIFIVPLPIHLSACQVAWYTYTVCSHVWYHQTFLSLHGDVCRIGSCTMFWTLTLISTNYIILHTHVISIPRKYGYLGIGFLKVVLFMNYEFGTQPLF